MIKKITLCLFTLVTTYSFSSNQIFETKNPNNFLSLKTRIIDRLFNFEKHPSQKFITNEKLKRGEINLSELKFDGLTLKNLDLSGMYLRNIDLSGCVFENINLENADLTDAKFNQAVLKGPSLKGAILYCPLDNAGQPIIEEAFRINNVDEPHKLVREYSYQRQKFEKNKDSTAEKITKSLNNVFPALYLDLSTKNLQNLNLTDMNFENVNLDRAHLQGVRLSKNVTIPNYKEEVYIDGKYGKVDYNLLFEAWCLKDQEHQEAYQKIANARFNLCKEVWHDKLLDGLKLKKNLRNCNFISINLSDVDLSGADLQYADLQYTNFQNANLTGADLQNTLLINANLQNANLIEAKFKNSSLSDAKFQNAKFTEKFQIPDYPIEDHTLLFEGWCFGEPIFQEVCQILVNNKFNICRGVEHVRIVEEIKLKKDLRDANLNSLDLQDADLTDANLQGASFYATNLESANLTGANLQDAYLKDVKLKDTILARTNLQGTQVDKYELVKANLRESNLRNFELSYANLEGKDLTGIQLQGARLSSAKLQRAILTHANLYESDLTRSNLSNANLDNAILSRATLIETNIKDASFRKAKLSEARLSIYFELPAYSIDEELLEIYNSCQDKESVCLLKYILGSKFGEVLKKEFTK